MCRIELCSDRVHLIVHCCLYLNRFSILLHANKHIITHHFASRVQELAMQAEVLFESLNS